MAFEKMGSQQPGHVKQAARTINIRLAMNRRFACFRIG